ncbi:MAG: 16S rRNA (guanine(527)-N(7))-methyltransferase RsmG [Pirellulales bacterium]|jgi:16S rRNA (guanine527-N7)-methyltransferase|nr:16S rRNA (guanine(527)-N(7))-methyltransferase RsmG [Pirellulales bacterium]
MSATSRSSTDLTDAIADACEQFQLEVNTAAQRQLAAYAASLWQWNERLNLTRHTDVERFVARDVADAVALADHLADGERVLDVGTGGGVPGVLLAILRPDLSVELSESVGKRAAAVKAIVQETGLRVPVHAQAAQSLLPAHRYDTLVVRAVAPLGKLLSWFEPLADTFGRLLVIKGPRWEAEKGEARHRGLVKDVRIRRVAAWPLHGTESESVLLEIHKRDQQP